MHTESRNRRSPRKAVMLLATTGLVFLVLFFALGLSTPKGIYLTGSATSSPRASVVSAPRLWNVTWGGANYDDSDSVWGDGTRIYTTGRACSFGDADGDLALLAWDPATGTKLWNKTWGGANYDEGHSVWGDGDRLYTSGYTYSYAVGSADLALVAWDPATGTKLWNKTWGGASADYGYSVWGDGTRVYIAGYTGSFGAVGGDFVLVAWDPATGTKLWNTTWGGAGFDIAHSVWGDGTQLYTTGFTQSFGDADGDLALVAWDPATGAKLWNTTWGGAQEDAGYSVWGDRSQVFTAGYTGNIGSGEADLALVAWDPATGTKLWNKTWGGQGNDIAQSIWGDGNRIFTAGRTASFGAGNYDFALVAWNPTSGTFLWSTTWGGAADDKASSTWGDGTQLYAAGETKSFTAGSTDFALVAWDVHFTISHPSDITYDAGTTGNRITWVVSCATSPAASYMVYRNGMIITSGTWTADQDIAIPVDNLATGTYSFMIVATDGFGGQVTDVIDLTVISPTAPLFSIPEILMSALLGLIFIAVFLRGRTGSPDSRARDVSPALVDSKGSGKQDVKDSKPTAPAKKTK